jgi:hypothetical protein
MIAALLAASALTASEPTAALWSLLSTSFQLSGPEPSVMLNQAQLAFAPAEDFQAKLIVRSGEEVLGETVPGQIFRAETMSAIQFRVRSVKLGTTPGPRSLDLEINGKSAGRLDFTLKKTATGWATSGPWADHAQVRWANDGRANNFVRFDYWVAGDEMPDAEAPFKAVFKRGAQVLAEGSDKYPSGPIWVKRTDNLRRPNGSFVTVGDMASLGNGPFVVDIVQAGKTVKSYRGSIAGGQFVLHPRSKENLTEGQRHLPPRDVGEAMNKLTNDVIVWLAP